MDKKMLSIVGLVVAILVIVGIFLMRGVGKQEEPVLEPTPAPMVIDEVPVNGAATTTELPSAATSTPSTSTTSTTPATSTMSEKPVVQGYTLAEVSAHADAKSCWTAINGSVYDVTSWINRHPGGPANVLKTCGRDASGDFTGQHEGEPRPEQMLASFRIGALLQ